MFRYIASRLVAMAIMIVLSTLIVFLIATQVPADPILAQLGDLQAADKNLVESYRKKWGLDRPIWQQYLIFLHGLTRGDFGLSISTQRPVLD
ncbi:MAG: ABC transporter permease, partial [Alphaproteobacteria bacterium]|nr:ABC transporter permease [Alphaproteobacteria bacterium]